MPISRSARVHPTALVSPESDVADDVEIGPYVVLEGAVKIGRGSIIRPYVHLCGPLTMGEANQIYSGAVLGERPQHSKYNNEPTGLEIGDRNIFREHVTVHRATTQAWQTRIGSDNFFMAHCHIAHDCQIGSRCVFANGALVAGHCEISDSVNLSGNCAMHQFTRVGRLAMLSGCSITTKDIPPFVMQQGINRMVSINVIGMRRSGMAAEEIDAVRRAFQIMFGDGQLLSMAMQQVEREMGQVAPVAEMIDFIRKSKRGVCSMREHTREAA